MSAKVKFWSNSSTPVKAKFSEYSSASASPVKSNKYKNFLTSVLTPSKTKQWLKKKKYNKSEESLKDNKTEIEGIYKDSQVSDDIDEPAYSSLQELRLKQTYPQSILSSSSILSTKTSENVHDSSGQFLGPLQPNTSGEPLYSIVNKQNKLSGLTEKDNGESLYKIMIEDQKEEIKLLLERINELTKEKRELAKENKELRKTIETIIKEAKWKEDSLHAELKLKITQLEADTHMEVKCLSEQIKTLQKERKVLIEQSDILYEEKKIMKDKYEDACNKVKSMVSPEFMKKLVDEHEIFLKEVKRTHLEDIKKLQQENESILESKIELIGEVEEFKEKLKLLITKNEALGNSEQELLQEKSRICFQLEESKQMQQEAQNMLLSLLKIAENISIERDVLFNKASFQDHQQKLLQSTIVDYSLNMGRLQEHISNMSREKLDELQKLKSGESQRDESMKKFYGKQLDLLHSKVLNQNNTINDLESEKSKLEVQLESAWQAAYTSGKTRVGDVKHS